MSHQNEENSSKVVEQADTIVSKSFIIISRRLVLFKVEHLIENYVCRDYVERGNQHELGTQELCVAGKSYV